MDEMAVHGNGTFDHDKKQWKLRTKELKLSATTRQLREMFKEDIPDSEKGSRPLWLKYLKFKRAEKAAELLGPTPIPTRIASLEGFITEFKEQGRDTAQLEEELADARTVPDWDIDHVDGPAVQARQGTGDGAGEGVQRQRGKGVITGVLTSLCRAADGPPSG
jgi:hypothetical protein